MIENRSGWGARSHPITPQPGQRLCPRSPHGWGHVYRSTDTPPLMRCYRCGEVPPHQVDRVRSGELGPPIENV